MVADVVVGLDSFRLYMHVLMLWSNSARVYASCTCLVLAVIEVAHCRSESHWSWTPHGVRSGILRRIAKSDNAVHHNKRGDQKRLFRVQTPATRMMATYQIPPHPPREVQLHSAWGVAEMEPPIRKISAGIRSNGEGRDQPDQHPHLRNGWQSQRHPDFSEVHGSTEEEVWCCQAEVQRVLCQEAQPYIWVGKLQSAQAGRRWACWFFITTLYCLAEWCGFRELHNEMIRDRLVVGLRDASLSERLQMDADLALVKAITAARQSDAVKKQQAVVRGTERQATNVDNIHSRQQQSKHKGAQQQGRHLPVQQRQKQVSAQKTCSRCGKSPFHGCPQCPAREATCHKCGKKGHYQDQPSPLGWFQLTRMTWLLAP